MLIAMPAVLSASYVHSILKRRIASDAGCSPKLHRLPPPGDEHHSERRSHDPAVIFRAHYQKVS
jgi:hypothetical protein